MRKWQDISALLLLLTSLLSPFSLAQEMALTRDAYHHQCPQWSPDGAWIVYEKVDRTSSHQLYKVSSSGGPEMALTFYGSNYNPEWSPDGAWVALWRKEHGTADTNGICRMTPDGGPEIWVTVDGGWLPQWSPDAVWIAFGKGRIYKIPSAGGSSIPLTPDDEWDNVAPQWSPNGAWLTYYRYRLDFWGNPVDHTICKVSSGGGPETELTGSGGYRSYPQWSPNGTWIAYHRQESGSYQIYKVASSGGPEIRLTSGPYDDFLPQWSPDSTWITYLKRDATGYWQVYRVSSLGGAEIALTSDGDHFGPQWSPDGAWIAYRKRDATRYWQIYKVASGVGVEGRKR